MRGRLCRSKLYIEPANRNPTYRRFGKPVYGRDLGVEWGHTSVELSQQRSARKMSDIGTRGAVKTNEKEAELAKSSRREFSSNHVSGASDGDYGHMEVLDKTEISSLLVIAMNGSRIWCCLESETRVFSTTF